MSTLPMSTHQRENHPRGWIFEKRPGQKSCSRLRWGCSLLITLGFSFMFICAAEERLALTGRQPVEPDNPLGLDDDTMMRLFETGKSLQRTAQLAALWAEDHHLRIPTATQLYEAYPHYQTPFGNDPFTEAKLRIEEVAGKIHVYSVGPDGQWDGGQSISPEDPLLKGDIGAEIEVGQHGMPRWLAQGSLLDYLQGKHTARFLAKKGKHYDSPALQAANTNLTFGPVVDGLSAAVELISSNGDFLIDQPIEMRMHVRNEANYEIQVAGAEWRNEDTLILEDEKGQPARDEYGRVVQPSKAWYSGMPVIKREILRPGQTMVFRSSALEFLSRSGKAQHPVGNMARIKPGNYRLRFRLSFHAWNAELMDWQGTLETGTVPISLKTGPATRGQTAKEGIDDERLVYFSGRVLDDETGRPLTNFWVQTGSTSREKLEEITWDSSFHGANILRPGAAESEQGKFWADSYRGSAGDNAWARVLADGYLPEPVTAEPLRCPFRVENLEVRMKRGRELRGKVHDTDGRPVAGVRIFLTGLEGVSEAQQQKWLPGTTALSDSAGQFTLRGVRGEAQQVRAFSKEGLAAAPMSVPADGQDLDITLP